jgi:hypothetical protein
MLLSLTSSFRTLRAEKMPIPFILRGFTPSSYSYRYRSSSKCSNVSILTMILFQASGSKCNRVIRQASIAADNILRRFIFQSLLKYPCIVVVSLPPMAIVPFRTIPPATLVLVVLPLSCNDDKCVQRQYPKSPRRATLLPARRFVLKRTMVIVRLVY